jgi:hypothetical protein
MNAEERQELADLMSEQMTLFDPRHVRINELIDHLLEGD